MPLLHFPLLLGPIETRVAWPKPHPPQPLHLRLHPTAPVGEEPVLELGASPAVRAAFRALTGFMTADCSALCSGAAIVAVLALELLVHSNGPSILAYVLGCSVKARCQNEAERNT